ncbi:MAG: RnfABCDGE type electron transport complex subunit D [bacterium]|nr:RnfABCDGE type electron transport complex subunit D [bacterium]
MKTLLYSSKIQISIFLLLIFISTFFYTSYSSQFLVFLTVLFGAIVSDLIFAKIRKIEYFFPSAAIVSALIITLLVSPQIELYKAAAISVLAMFFKNFLRVSNRNIFNPAALGLLMGAVIFNEGVTWWGVSWQNFQLSTFNFQLFFLILLSPLLISIIRMKRYAITLSFLLTYGVLFSILNTKHIILNTFFDPTVLFFSLVMLPEPMTSPNNHTKQILFGAFVALLSFIISLPLFSFVPDVFIVALLVGNMVFFKLR